VGIVGYPADFKKYFFTFRYSPYLVYSLPWSYLHYHINEDMFMVLEKYEQESLLFNTNFKAKTSEEGMHAYRGELVLIKGEVADAQGRCKPPTALVRSAVLLTKGEKLCLVAGFIDELALLNTFLEKYAADFAPDMKALFYVVNLTTPTQVNIDGINFVLIPLQEGVAWNELIEELGMEKKDFKGQSSADKVVTAWEAFKDYAPKYDSVSLDEAFSRTAEIKREARGAV
jgi:hypothetical protein